VISFISGRMASVAAVMVAFVALVACGKPASPYVFSATQSEVSMDGNAVIDVKIIHQPTGKAVENAVIFETRLDMGPDAMGEMTAPVTAQGSPAPGVYRFTVAPTMAGRWELKLSAKVQGEAETVTGSVVVTAR
jgi:YtkA-like